MLYASLLVSGTSIPDCDRPGHRISLHFPPRNLQFCHIFATAAGKETSGRSTGLPRQCAHWLAMTRLFGLGRLTIPPSASPTPPFTQGRLSAAAGVRAANGRPYGRERSTAVNRTYKNGAVSVETAPAGYEIQNLRPRARLHTFLRMRTTPVTCTASSETAPSRHTRGTA